MGDPTAVLLSILTIMPKITNDKLEDECVASDLLQFLKIICHQFTNNILTIDDQERIGFYEPHLQKTDSLSTSSKKQKGRGLNIKKKMNKFGPSDPFSNPKDASSSKKRISHFLYNKKDVTTSLMAVYANDPKRNILADEHYLNNMKKNLNIK